MASVRVPKGPFNDSLLLTVKFNSGPLCGASNEGDHTSVGGQVDEMIAT